MLSSDLFEFISTCIATPEDLSGANDHRVFLWIIGSIITWNLEDSWNGLLVLNDHIAHALSRTLRNQDDANVWAMQKASQRLVNVFVLGVTLNDHEVLDASIVSLTHAREQESSDS